MNNQFEDDDSAFRINDSMATRSDILPLVLYKSFYICAIVIPPILFAQNATTPGCKMSPHYATHIIFLAL